MPLLSLIVPAVAQCDPVVQPGFGIPGVDGEVAALAPWDPDGPGPLGMHIVVAGSFSALVDRRVISLGLFDPATLTCSALGDCDGRVNAVVVLANGDLVVGGTFTSVAGVAAARIARFDGATWSPLGSGIASTGFGGPEVRAIVELPNGDIVASGPFTNILGMPTPGIARFDGTTWSGLGTFSFGGFATIGPESLCVLGNGDLVAGGSFDRVDNLVVNGLARWDGSNWHAFGSGPGTAAGWPYVSSLATRQNGDLLVGGHFDRIDGVIATNIAIWNGTTWAPLGSGPGGWVYDLHVQPTGELVVVGAFSLPGGLTSRAARWNGSNWQVLGFDSIASTNSTTCITSLPGGGLLAGGTFTTVAGQHGRGLMRWSGTAWSPVVVGTLGTVQTVLTLRDGRTFAGGTFRSIGGVPAQNAAVFGGSGWQAMAMSMPAIASAVEMPDGAIVAVGNFLIGSSGQASLRRWNGTAWDAIGLADGHVAALAVSPTGDLVVGGDFLAIGGVAATGLASWNGTTWSSVVPNFTGQVTALDFLADGRLVVGGVLYASSAFLGFLGAWNGATWDTLAGGVSQPPVRVSVARNGDLFAIGNFNLAGGVTAWRIARWDGVAWSALGTGLAQPARSLATLPNGDVLVGGTFAAAGGTAAQNVARWNGTTWNAIGTGADGSVDAIAASADGSIVLGGAFIRVDGVTTASVARLEPSCPAVVTRYGSLCLQGSVLPDLTIVTPAWSGGALRSTAMPLPTNSVVLAIYGFQPTLQLLTNIVPIGVPGCALFAQPDLVTLSLAAAGRSDHVLPLPRSAILVGLNIYHQVLPVEVSAGGALLSLGGTPAVAATIGAMW